MSDAPDFSMPGSGREQDTAIPRFYIEAQRNNRRSEEEGAPRFDDVEMVEILIPGDRKTSMTRIVTAEVKARFARQYSAWKADGGEGIDGTPLSELPGMTASQIQELNYQHIRNCETLATLSDDQAAKAVSMGGMALRDRAKRWLEATAGDAANERLAAENRAKDERIAALEDQMADLLKRIPAADAPKQTQPET